MVAQPSPPDLPYCYPCQRHHAGTPAACDRCNRVYIRESDRTLPSCPDCEAYRLAHGAYRFDVLPPLGPRAP